MKPALLLLLFLVPLSGNVAQQSTTLKCEYRFGTLKSGDIDLTTLLADSIRSDCSVQGVQLTITGFGLVTKCEGITRYFRNEKNGALTNEMKSNVRTLKPGCEIEFLSIWGHPPGRFSAAYITGDALKFRLK